MISAFGSGQLHWLNYTAGNTLDCKRDKCNHKFFSARPISANSNTLPDLIDLLSLETLNWGLLLTMMYCIVLFGAAEINNCSMMAFFIWSTQAASEHFSMSAKAPHNHPKKIIGKHHENNISHTVFSDPFVCWSRNISAVDSCSVHQSLCIKYHWNWLQQNRWTSTTSEL